MNSMLRIAGGVLLGGLALWAILHAPQILDGLSGAITGWDSDAKQQWLRIVESNQEYMKAWQDVEFARIRLGLKPTTPVEDHRAQVKRQCAVYARQDPRTVPVRHRKTCRLYK